MLTLRLSVCWIPPTARVPGPQRLQEHAYSQCNPSSFGTSLRLAIGTNPSDVVELVFGFSGEGLHGGSGRRGVQVTLESHLTASYWSRLLEFGTTTRPFLSDGKLSVGLAARLVGPSITALTLNRPPRCSWLGKLCPWIWSERLVFDFEYSAGDAGEYLLEILLTHALGQPVNHLAYRGLIVVPRVPGDDVSNSEVLRKVCNHGHNAGRWLLQAAGTPQDDFLDDQLGYNRGYRWTPHNCRYRRYTRQRLAHCLRRCHYHNIGLGGDSIGREQLTGLYQLMAGCNATVDGRLFKHGSNELEVLGDAQGSQPRLRLLWNVPPPFAHNGGQRVGGAVGGAVDVYVCVPLIVTLLAEGMSVARASAWLSLRLVDLRRKCGAHGLVCIYLTHPAVQRTPILDQFSPGARYGHRLAMRNVTRQHVRAVSTALTKLARKLGFYVVDAHDITDARWYASWDGVHYLFSSRHAATRPADWTVRFQWQGGVAHAITTVLLNTLCNRCLPPLNPFR